MESVQATCVCAAGFSGEDCGINLSMLGVFLPPFFLSPLLLFPSPFFSPPFLPFFFLHARSATSMLKHFSN